MSTVRQKIVEPLSSTDVTVYRSQKQSSERHPPSSKFPHGLIINHGEEWIVEAIDMGEDGAIEQTVFRGSNMQERALTYARNHYCAEVRVLS